MGRFRLVLCLAAMLLLGAAWLGQGAFASQQNNSTWAAVSNVIPAATALYGVYMQDAKTAWIAGREGSPDDPNPGRIYEISWDGSKWNLGATYTLRSTVRAVVAISANNVWAVGDNALIVHMDNSGWHDVDSLGLDPGTQLLTLQMLGSGEEGWFGGWIGSTVPPVGAGTGLVGHISNGRVDLLNAVASVPVNSLHLTQGGGWMVGDNEIWRNGRQGWASESSPLCPSAVIACYQYLNGVRAVSSDEAWAVGTRDYACAECPPAAMIFHRTGGMWHEALPLNKVQGQPQVWGTNLHAVSFTRDGFGLAVGDSLATPAGPSVPYILSYGKDGAWHYEYTPAIAKGTLNAVAQVDSGHAIAVGDAGAILTYGYARGVVPPTPAATPTLTPAPVPTALPTGRVADPHDPRVLYFPLVGHTLRGTFRDYWQAHGGLQQFGYPLTEQFEEMNATDGKTYVTQYFERARFESHPENRSPYNVLLGLLGRSMTQGRETEVPFQRTAPQAGQSIMYFEATGHNVPLQFSTYWQTHGGLPVYGYPISEAFTEISPTDGKPYLVQYFERNRLEYHPESPEPYRVTLGLLGVQLLQQRGWLQAH